METNIFNTIIRDSDNNDLCYISESGHKYILMEGVEFPNSPTSPTATYDLIFIIDSDLFDNDIECNGFVGLLFGASYVNDPDWLKYIAEKVTAYEQKRRINNGMVF